RACRSSSRFFLRSRAHGVYGSPPSMFPPASKKVATGGPFGSKGNGGVVKSTGIPPRPPPGFAPAGALPCLPRPPPGGPLLACIQSPEKSGFPSAVRGVGASPRTLPLGSRGTFASRTVAHCAAIGRAPSVRTPNTRTVSPSLFIIINSNVLRLALPAFRTPQTRPHSHTPRSHGRFPASNRQT